MTSVSVPDENTDKQGAEHETQGHESYYTYWQAQLDASICSMRPEIKYAYPVTKLISFNVYFSFVF